MRWELFLVREGFLSPARLISCSSASLEEAITAQLGEARLWSLINILHLPHKFNFVTAVQHRRELINCLAHVGEERMND